MIGRERLQRLPASYRGLSGHVFVRCVMYAQLPDCGCRVYLGRREDNDEPATVAVSCQQAHRPVMARFNELYTESLRAEDPVEGARPAIEVVDEVLQKAAA